MKVLLANKYFYLRGGAERVFFQERDLLRAMKIDVVDFSMEWRDNVPSDYAEFFVTFKDFQASHSLLEKISLSGSFIHNREAVRNIEALVERESPDIAHLHNIYHHLTPSIIPALKRHGVKVIVTLHDFKLRCPAYLMLDKSLRICDRCQGRKFYKALTSNCQGSLFRSGLMAVESCFHRWRKSWSGVDLFITPSRFMRDMVSGLAPVSRVEVLVNGIETNELIPDWQDQGYVLYLGRLSREKGLYTLMQAHEGLDIPLRVAGSGPEEEALRRRFPNPEFLGYRSGEDLQRLIRQCSIVVVPSEWYENCPMVILEAMAFGKPVLATRLGGIPDLVEDSITGRLVAPGDVEGLRRGMIELMEDRELRNQMGRAARQRAESKHSLEEHGRGLLEIYERVLA